MKEEQLINNRYRLISLKGRGAFGEVWLAHDEQAGIDVAIKIYIALDESGIEDFKSEYTNTFSLNHPNILHANYFDVIDSRPFLVMPYCPGSAESLIGTTDETIIWRFISDVANGLKFLHSKNILHRDIKPDNVLVDKEGNFLITDFGVSKKMKSTLRRNSTRIFSSNEISGTVGYMAPELFSSTPEAVKATDIWAFGVTLYEIIAQELPFFGNGGVMLENGAQIPEINGSWSDELKRTIQACLAKNTWDRPTAEQLAVCADAIIQGVELPKLPWLGKKTEGKPSNKDCSICTKRAFDKKKGLVCGITMMKPDESKHCGAFVIDEFANIRKKEGNKKEGSEINGWTAFFLIVFVGLGLLISTITTILALFKIKIVFSLIVTILWLAALIIIGIKTIIAFYTRKENAIALATTYLLMILTDGILSLIGGNVSIGVCIHNIVVSCIWLIYIHKSKDLKELFPKENRKWYTLEKVLLPFYLACSISIIMFTTASSYYSKINEGKGKRGTTQKQSLPENNGSNYVIWKDGNSKQTPIVEPSKSSTNGKKSIESEGKSVKDSNGEILRVALQNKNYSTVKTLADRGYTPAYIPLAKHYLQDPSTHDLADRYAKKAKRAGLSKAQEIIDDLTALGYYD